MMPSVALEDLMQEEQGEQLGLRKSIVETYGEH
jgi:hypothetical protein